MATPEVKIPKSPAPVAPPVTEFKVTPERLIEIVRLFNKSRKPDRPGAQKGVPIKISLPRAALAQLAAKDTEMAEALATAEAPSSAAFAIALSPAGDATIAIMVEPTDLELDQ